MGVKRGQGVIHKHYSMPVILLGTIGYAIIVIITILRRLEGSADSMQWRRVGLFRLLLGAGDGLVWVANQVRWLCLSRNSPFSWLFGKSSLLYPATEALRTERRSSSPLLLVSLRGLG
jgi:hypothetical protein